MRVPIAGTDVDAIELHVGRVIRSISSRAGYAQAVLVKPFNVGHPVNPQAPLWHHRQCNEFAARLFPDLQVWVHVDYRKYRSAYIRLGMPPLASGMVLDHIRNREAVRLNWYLHPYLRLCPVSSQVNTSSGHKAGPEGMERETARSGQSSPAEAKRRFDKISSYDIEYADPVDLTKMLNMATGTKEMPEVGALLNLFYPA